MRRLATIIGLLSLALLIFGCSHDRINAPEPSATGSFDAELTAAQIVRTAGWAVDPEAELNGNLADLMNKRTLPLFTDFQREVLCDNIVHYSFLVKLGPGQYDAVRLHRVFKERRNLCPPQTAETVFLLHGDGVGFVKFLFGSASANAPDDHAAAIYLAADGVDVWGIDQNWVLVPEEETNFDFMAEWDMQNQIDNVRSGMAVARLVRLLTGSGYDQMPLLGYSSGSFTGYASLNMEAGLPECRRHIKGFICADGLYKFGPENEAGRLAMCGFADYYQSVIDSGTYCDPTGIMFKDLGYLSQTDPLGMSPYFEGLTNEDAFFLFAGQTHLLMPINPYFHYFSPVVTGGVIVDLNDTPRTWGEDFCMTACPYEAVPFMADYCVIMCGEEIGPYDDKLSAITVPVLCLVPAGGMGDISYYTLSLLGSTDVTILDIQVQAEDQPELDYGHIDIWTASSAPQLVWEPMLQWIEEQCPAQQPNLLARDETQESQ